MAWLSAGCVTGRTIYYTKTSNRHSIADPRSPAYGGNFGFADGIYQLSGIFRTPGVTYSPTVCYVSNSIYGNIAGGAGQSPHDNESNGNYEVNADNNHYPDDVPWNVEYDSGKVPAGSLSVDTSGVDLGTYRSSVYASDGFIAGLADDRSNFGHYQNTPYASGDSSHTELSSYSNDDINYEGDTSSQYNSEYDVVSGNTTRAPTLTVTGWYV